MGGRENCTQGAERPTCWHCSADSWLEGEEANASLDRCCSFFAHQFERYHIIDGV